MPKQIVHCKKEPFDVYIGRPSIWGNPFTHIADRHTSAEFIVSSREEAIARYRDYVLGDAFLMSKLPSLKGRVLGCWCDPLPCHGQVLLDLIEELKL